MSGFDTTALEGGFADLVGSSQSVFRAVMDAFSRPALAQTLPIDTAPPAPLTPELAAVALSLCDHDSPLWLDATLSASPAVVAWLKFHTGAPITADPKAAHFALVSDSSAMPALDAFSLGTDEYPDRSTTIVAAVASLSNGPELTLTGPGIKHSVTLAIADLPAGFTAQWTENREMFPRGVDLLFVAAGQVIGLPRSSRISSKGQ